ncbi:tetratricopeptide repeat protein [Candidatus Marithrix sp. Canyon 246]|uniref:tetratricopeptide repeat protein n=1 Tax=Candidatus Marithrix sp. Canyon 246 TaxID=1827136 RepID=UPI00084A238A|nr:tetratricopeptide repeat protein [Candidatus Marithrix sp. Canyon 246]
MKSILNKIWLIIVANILMGCSSQLRYGGAVAQEVPAPYTKQNKVIPYLEDHYLVSQHEEAIYKILVAEIARLRGNNLLAAQYFLDVAQKTKNAKLAESATEIAFLAKQDDLAMNAARLWVSLTPNNPNVHQILGKLFLNQKRPDEALKHLDIILNILKDNPEKLNTILEGMLEQQKQGRALKFLQRLVKNKPNHPTVLFIYARVLINANKLTPALAVLKKLLKIVPDHEQAVPLYAYILEKQHKITAAINWLRTTLEKFPDKQEWRLMFARMLADNGNYQESIKEFKRLLLKYPNQADILYALGILSLQTNNNSAAKLYFTKLTSKVERADSANYYLGQIAQREKDFQNAIKWYKQIQGGPNYINAQTKIALILKKLGKLEQAINHLQTVAENHPKNAIRLLQLEAELLFNAKLYDKALDTYNKAIKLDPDNTEILYLRALLYEKMGNLTKLEQELRRILVIDPDNVTAINALGYSLAENSQRYAEAYKLIQKAFSLKPNDYYILDSMGWILYKMGRYVEAIAYLRKAYTKKADAEIAAHLGEALWQNGEQKEAKIIWQNALQNFPKDKELQKVMRRFLSN